MAIASFRDQTTADIAAAVNSKAARVIPQTTWAAARRKLDALESATSLQDLSLPGMRLEALKGSLAGFYSIRVNQQYRVVFRFAEGKAYDVQVADYH